MTREALPRRRYSESSDFRHLGIRYAMQIGIHPDGHIGEVFLQMHKAAGTMADVNARDTSILISLAIQHGVPLDRMLAAITRDGDGKAEGFAGAVLTHLQKWKPIVPAAAKVEEARAEQSNVPVVDLGPKPMTREEAKGSGYTGDQCTNCSSMRMNIAGHCLVCADCGTTTGCS